MIATGLATLYQNFMVIFMKKSTKWSWIDPRQEHLAKDKESDIIWKHYL